MSGEVSRKDPNLQEILIGEGLRLATLKVEDAQRRALSHWGADDCLDTTFPNAVSRFEALVVARGPGRDRFAGCDCGLDDSSRNGESDAVDLLRREAVAHRPARGLIAVASDWSQLEVSLVGSDDVADEGEGFREDWLEIVPEAQAEKAKVELTLLGKPGGTEPIVI